MHVLADGILQQQVEYRPGGMPQLAIAMHHRRRLRLQIATHGHVELHEQSVGFAGSDPF